MTSETISHYRILQKIGAGGMGEVYLAEDTRLDRKVALKVLPAEFTQDAGRVRRFMQEAKAASALNHPNIITVYDIGESEAGRFIVMELVAGRTIRAVIAEDNSVETLLTLGHQMARALSAAHAAGITHRDLKPDNIMVRDDGYVKVLDFGLARLLPTGSGEDAATLAQQTTPGTIMGTAAYMSPEQARGETISHPSDIFALGIVLYELATGQHPFKADTLVGYLHAITLQTAPSLTSLKPEMPAALAALILRMLEKAAGLRPTGSEVAQALLEMERHGMPSAQDDKLGSDASAQEEEANTQILAAVPTAQSLPPETGAVQTTSSAEYLVGQITKHKRSAAALLAVLLAAVSGTGYWLFNLRGSDEAINSLAVLPFQNRSAGADSEYLSDGLAESLIYRLSQLPNLKVSPTSSVFRYKGKETDPLKVGSELGVQAVMSGRMVQRGENLTISVELVDVRNNKTLWGEQYERKLSDLLATQREIAAEITNKLQLKLSGADEAKVTKSYTANPEAYQFYLRGRYYWNKRDAENLRKAIEQFKAAVEKDPRYALAYAGFADCYLALPFFSDTPSTEVLPQAKSYANRALEIDNSLGEVHASLANINMHSWNWAEAEKGYKRALELNPNYAQAHKWYGNLLLALGRFDEALAKFKRAQELEPLSLIFSLNLSDVYLAKGDLNAAFEQCQRAIALDPNWYFMRQQLGLVYLKQGRTAEALAEAEKSVVLSKRLSYPLGVLGYIYAQTGKRSEAKAVVEELKERYVKRQANGNEIARVYVGLGEKEQAFAWLEKDFQSRDSTMSFWFYLVPLDSLRDDPRFKDLVKRMGMPE